MCIFIKFNHEFKYPCVFRKLLTEMDTIIGCVTDLLPEKAPLDNPKEVIKSVQTRLKNTNS